MKTRVVIISGSAILRSALCSLIAKQSDMEAVGEGNLREPDSLASLIQERKPDVAVLVWGVSDPGTVATHVRRVRVAHPSCRVVFITELFSRYLIHQAKHSGVVSCLSLQMDSQHLIEAVHRAAAGGVYFPSDEVGRDPASIQQASDVIGGLTSREREVLKLLASGKNTKEAAAILGVSGKTVETHRLHIMNKLDLQSLADLTKLAIREGLTALGL